MSQKAEYDPDDTIAPENVPATEDAKEITPMTTTQQKKKPAATEAYENIAATTKESVEAVFRAGAEAASKAFTMNRDRVESFTKGYEGLAKAGQETVAAMMSASNAMVKGAEALHAESLAFGKAAIEENIAAVNAVVGVKNPQEFFDLQTHYAKSAWEKLLQQNTKIGEMSVKVAREALDPLVASLQSSVEKFVKPLSI